jgi:hypothetical protein
MRFRTYVPHYYYSRRSPSSGGLPRRWSWGREALLSLSTGGGERVHAIFA